MNSIRPVSDFLSHPMRGLRAASFAAAAATALVLAVAHPVRAQGAAAATAAPTSAEAAQLRAQHRLWDLELAFQSADQRLNAADADLRTARRIRERAQLVGMTRKQRAKHELAIERANARHSAALATAREAKAALDRARAEFDFADQQLRAERGAQTAAAPATPAAAS
jgi:hypothetical protein